MKIDLRNLSHSYDVKVLNDINFNLKGYKSVAIIGISGSGKSTLLRLLSGLETPTKGKVFINDSIPCSMLGMNADLMCQYIEAVAVSFNYRLLDITQ